MDNSIGKEFDGKTLLITGGTGSFGNAVIRRFLNSGLKEIRVFSRDEKKQDDMRKKYANPKIKFYLGDVRNYQSIDQAMPDVDYVFHAAALKQVPSCEFYPMEAVNTNITGTNNTVNAVIKNGVKRMVLLSTDKAVYPINAMGMSKALAEKVVTANSRNITSGTVLNITRYGNVMASRGSVIPLFTEQAKSDRDITITDPNMTRFMMSLDDAVDLVVYAFLNGAQGDTFIQKAPAATIMNLAQTIIGIFHSKSRIRVIGTRHGEKRHETLLTREEFAKARDLGDYYCIPNDTKDLNYSLYYEKGDQSVADLVDYTSENTKRLAGPELKELLLKLDYIQSMLD